MSNSAHPSDLVFPPTRSCW